MAKDASASPLPNRTGPNGTSNESRYRAPALDRGLDILELLAAQHDGLTRSQIQTALGRGPSEIYRMLERLVARGYVLRSEAGDRYALSLRLHALAQQHPPNRRLAALAQPLMDQFTRQMRQACHLVVPQRGVGVVFAQSSPLATWEFRVRPGAELDLLGTGSGLTLLAHLDETARATLLAMRDRPERTEAQAEAFAPELAQIRKQGYRRGPSLQLVGVEDISVPVCPLPEHMLAVLTCPFIPHPDGTAQESPDATLAALRTLAQQLAGGSVH